MGDRHTEYKTILEDDDQGPFPDHMGALRLIQTYGLYSLSGSDGCSCAHTTIRGVSIDVSCHKSNGGLDVRWPVVHVHDSGSQIPYRDLIPLAQEVSRQVLDGRYSQVWMRLCDWDSDYKKTCVYCSKPRPEGSPEAYLCAKCQTGKDGYGDPIAAHYALPEDWNWMTERVLEEPA